jgi:2-polyprenyl-3-methyl-5-hydroxy-6-metoxy-1,4-benzoquinol methylase
MIFREIKELFSYHSQFSKRFAQHDVQNVFNKTMDDLKKFGFEDLKGKRILDLGCGQRFPLALQCASYGAVVTALVP